MSPIVRDDVPGPCHKLCREGSLPVRSLPCEDAVPSSCSRQTILQPPIAASSRWSIQVMTRALNGMASIGLGLHTSLRTRDACRLQGIVECFRPLTHLERWTAGEEDLRGRRQGLGGGRPRSRSSSLESAPSMSSVQESDSESDSDSDSQDDGSDDETIPPPSLSKMALTSLCNIREAFRPPTHQTLAPTAESILPPPSVEGGQPVTLPRPRGALPLENSPSDSSLPTPPVPTQRRSPKSLSRPLRNSSSSSPPCHPPKPAPLPTIEVHLQVARLALTGFSKFKTFFHHELSTPELQSVFDNPIPEHVVEAELSLQPMIVTHRMYWQGAQSGVPEALAVALDTSLTSLVITNCKIALDDVIAVLVLVVSLEALEVREVTRDDAAVAPSFLHKTLTESESLQVRPHGLKSLTLKTRVPLDALFRRFNFKRLDLLSLRLHDRAIHTSLDFLSPEAKRRHNIRSARIRGNFTLSELERLRGWLEDLGVSFDVERLPPN